MLSPTLIKDRLTKVFSQEQAKILAELLFESYSNLVQASDFHKLKEVVKERKYTL